jgi:hydrogenase/urease accessory protein HupE
VALSLPLRAEAHSNIEGLDEFANGLLHPLFTPAHVLVLLAFGLWIGRYPPLKLRSPLPAFAMGSLIGLALAWKGVAAPHPAVLLVMAMIAGAAIASDFKISLLPRVILAAVAGMLLGMDSAPDAASTPTAVMKTLLGTWIGLYIWLVNPAFYSSLLPKKKWADYAVRIAASWIIAISFMVVALSFKK